MMKHVKTARIALMIFLGLGFLALSPRAGAVWLTRPGTIGEAMSLRDGSQVALDAVVVDKIAAHKSPQYLVVKEWYDSAERLIVLTPPSQYLRLGQSVDITGTLTTLPSGYRAITNAAVYGYLTKESGDLSYKPVWKGINGRTSWPWMVDLTVPASTAGNSLMTVPAPGPNPNPNTPDYYANVADVLSLDDDTPVLLECKPVIAVGTDATYGAYYEIQDDGGSGTLRVYSWYAGYVATGDRVNLIVGQMQTQGTMRTLDINTGPGFTNQIVQGQEHVAPQGMIGWAKTYPDETSVTLVGKVVSATITDFPGALYIQESDRSSGLRVLYTGTAQPSRGSLVSVTGTLGLGADGERQIDAGSSGITVGNQSTAPVALGMNNRTIGGWDYNIYTPGVNYISPAIGFSTKGLLIRTWGSVTRVDTDHNCFYIDDGSQMLDGSGFTGVKVSWDWDQSGKGSITPPNEGDYVSVTGISGSEQPHQGEFIRVIRVRDQSDVSVIATPTPLSSLQFDRGLPTSNVNDSVGPARTNVRWAGASSNIAYGDDFKLPSLPQGQYWYVHKIRVWIVPEMPLSTAYALGDLYSSISLYTGGTSGGLGLTASGTFAAGDNGTNNPNLTIRPVTYNANEQNYQGPDGVYHRIWQVEFANLDWQVTGGTSYVFMVSGVPRIDRLLFNHASVYSTPTGDGYIRQFDVSNPGAGTTVVSGSAWFSGKGSDINVQVYAHSR